MTERLSTFKPHGFLGQTNWPAPKMVSKSDKPNRPDQGNTTNASEYMDEPEVLDAKVELLANLLRKAKCCTAYTGAGLSRAAGIGDYASKSNSIMSKTVPVLKSPCDAEPTYAHRILVALERAGYLHHYVQQNHDGLPQKAGFPQEKINEIHGAWYDPSNPVVQFSGNLRGDFFKWMLKMEQETDLCLCLGTSLSGMNADRMAETPAKKSLKKKSKSLGTVIINLQQTRLDDVSSIRIWGTLDETFELLAKKLNLNVQPISIDPPMGFKRNKYIIPYNEQGLYDPEYEMIWDLSNNAKIKVQNPKASNFNEEGVVYKQDSQGNFIVILGKYQYRFGKWWISCAMEGKWPFHLPFINVNPIVKKVEPKKIVNSDVIMIDNDDSIDFPSSFTILQTHESMKDGNHLWSLSVKDDNAGSFIKHVVWHLHDTFTPPNVTCATYPYTIKRSGWGVFKVKFTITLIDNREISGIHALTFSSNLSETKIKL